MKSECESEEGEFLQDQYARSLAQMASEQE